MPTSKVYCICRQPWGNQAMIQCEFCLRWYHCCCVGLPNDICNDKYHESDIVYFCSIDKCNSGIPHCSVKGNNIVVGSAVCNAVLTSHSVNNDSVPVSSVMHSDLKPVVSVSGNYSVPVSSAFLNDLTPVVSVSSVLRSDLKSVVSVSGNYSVPVSSAIVSGLSADPPSSVSVSGVSVSQSFGQSNGDFNLDNCVESILHCPLSQQQYYVQQLPASAMFTIIHCP